MTILDSCARWLVDLYLLASVILVVTWIVTRCMRQPSRRMAVGRSAIVAILVLAVIAALPTWPRAVRFGDAPNPGSAPRHEPIAAIHERPELSSAVRPPAPRPNTTTPVADRTHARSHVTPARVAPAPPAAPDAPSTTGPPRKALLFLFLGGALIVALWSLLGAIQAWRLVANSTPAPRRMKSLLSKLARSRGCRPRLRISATVREPLVLGWWRPTILLPASFARTEPLPSLQLALAHEWAHVESGDLRVIAQLRLLLPLLFAHPLYWWLRRRIRRDQELLADASAARVSSRTEYAETLVRWARACATPRPILPLAALPLFQRPSELRRRIEMLLSSRIRVHTRCARTFQIATRIVAVALVLSLSLITSAPATTQDAAKVSTPDASQSADGEVLVRGRVVDSEGRPVAGAKVHFARPFGKSKGPARTAGSEEPGSVRVSTESGADGSFTLRIPENAISSVPEARDATRILVQADGHAIASVPAHDEDTSEVVVTVEPGRAIEGQILSGEGTPIEGAQVKLRSGRTELLAYLGPLQTSTDEEGRFRFPGFGDLHVWLEVSADGYASTQIQVTNDEETHLRAREEEEMMAMSMVGNVRPRALVRSEFVHLLSPGRAIHGQVVDESGSPLANVRVSTWMTSDHNAVTDAEGRYRIDGVPKVDRLDVRATPQSPGDFLPAKIEVADGEGLADVEVDFALSRGVVVSGQVLDDQGRPVARSHVTYVALPDNQDLRGTPTGAFFESGRHSAQTDDEGSFSMAIPPGPAVLLANARNASHESGQHYLPARYDPERPIPGYRDEYGAITSFAGWIEMLITYSAYRVIEPPTDAAGLEVNLVLSTGGTRVVRFVDEAGNELTGVEAHGKDELLMGSWTPVEGSRLEMAGLDPAHSRMFFARHAERNLVGQIDLAPGTDECTMVLSPAATVKGRVIDRFGRPVASAQVWAHLLAEDVGLSRGIAITWGDLRTESDGRFELSGLFPGSLIRVGASQGTAYHQVEGLDTQPGETIDLGDLPLQER